MAINLASKYESQILTKWVKDSFLAGKFSDKYSFAGVRTVRIYTPTTVELSEYNRSGSNRFGSPVEMQDTIQELTLSKEPSFAITIDKGNNADQLNIKGAGEMMQLQMREKLVPYTDKYALEVFAKHAGNSAVISAPTKSTIVGLLADGLTVLDNAEVPDDMRSIFIGASNYNKLRLADEFIVIDPLGEATVGRGVVGSFMGAEVVKVPDSYMPEGVQFLIAHRDSAILPIKLKTVRILTDVAGLDGALLEARQYFDAFVLGQKAVGLYAGVLSANKVADPVIALTDDEASVGAVSGVSFKYTVDGSDPRFSSSAVAYSGAVTLLDGQTIKVFGSADGKCDSDVVEETYSA